MEPTIENLNFIKEESKVSPQKKPPLRAEDYCLQAEKLLKNNQWSQAQNILQKGLLEVEKSAKAYHLLGLALYHQGSFKASLKYFRRACAQEQNPEYFLNLSIALNDLGQYEEARQAYQQAERIKTQTQEQNWREEVGKRHLQIAEVYLKKQLLKPALQEYIKSFSFYPQSTTQLEIARLLWNLNQKQQAEKHLNNFIRACPNNVEAHLLLAEWYFEKKQLPQAVNEWERVLKLNPENEQAKKHLLKVQQLTEFFS